MEIRVRHAAGFFVVSFVVMALLGILAAVAVPNVGTMISRNEAEARASELNKVQTAVTEMLYDSIAGELEPVGPTSDMNKVCTRDIYPLVLTEYLGGFNLDTGCSYSFTADGTVVQVAPR